MDVFNVISLLGGLGLFLFGMGLMNDSLKKRAGYKLKTILMNLTSNPFKGFLLGLVATVAFQSSSATMVMIVGFVNSGIMEIRNTLPIILGANLGSTITSWVLSLTGIEGTSVIAQIFQLSTFTPAIALIGMLMYMVFKEGNKKRDTGLILMGFAILMYGMLAMSDAVTPLKEDPAFQSILVAYQNPFLGLLTGMLFTGVIQSSGAAIGILQALALTTGQVSLGTAIPIIIGADIGTCVTGIIASFGTNRDARRTALVHLFFNIFSAVCLMIPFTLLKSFVPGFSSFMETIASPLSIAICCTCIKLIDITLLSAAMPSIMKFTGILIPEKKSNKEIMLLNDRLLSTPAVAVEHARTVTNSMAKLCEDQLQASFQQIYSFNEKKAMEMRAVEEKIDKYEDVLGTYLVKLSSMSLTIEDSNEVSKLLHIIGDIERIADHSLNILNTAEEMNDKKISFSDDAKHEIQTMMNAVTEIMTLSVKSFIDDDSQTAELVEPLEQTVDYLKDVVRNNHIIRLRKSVCTIEMGFVLEDMLINLERISDHCSNIAVAIIEIDRSRFNTHSYLSKVKSGEDENFRRNYSIYMKKYTIDETK